MPSQRDTRVSSRGDEQVPSRGSRPVTVQSPRLEDPDLASQFEDLLHLVWLNEAAWRKEDHIDLAARLNRD